ncbi:hypothetical protein N7510_008980 [Penicillium lagena]|uniref:uncharacterized protein n=1 Tax=Penicillium lagena TaxID=94218 RepID=UPI002540CCCC|nr:uncharacterized protein N7510_008980 [Penicillium lagena]KAJ5606199.1 hypothetical protein N7510_008980 [Penicillium lagena]
MLPLLDFSEDILRLIVSHVDLQRDFAALARSCKVLHRLCDMNARRRYRRIRLCSSADLERGLYILLSMLRNPQLRDYVRHIELDSNTLWNDTLAKDRQQHKKPLTNEDKQLLLQATEAARFPKPIEEHVFYLLKVIAEGSKASPLPSSHKDRDDVDRNIGDALCAVLITVCPRLQSMATTCLMRTPSILDRKRDQGEEFMLSRRPTELILRRSGAKPSKYPFSRNLRDITIIPHGRGWASSLGYHKIDIWSSLRPIMGLPAIESVTMHAVKCPEWMTAIEPAHRSSNIRRLRFPNANLDWRILKRSIESCKALTEFTLTAGVLHLDIDACVSSNWYWQESDDYELCDDVGWDDEIEREIWEDSHEAEESLAEDGAHIAGKPWPLDLRDIGVQSCRRVPIPADSWTLVGSIPQSLQSLQITGYKKGRSPLYDDHITALLAERESQLPNLKTIEGLDQQVPVAKKVVANPAPEVWSEYED